jgi:hypothetical protein
LDAEVYSTLGLPTKLVDDYFCRISKIRPAADGSGYGVSHPHLGFDGFVGREETLFMLFRLFFAIYGGIQLSPKTKANRRFQIHFHNRFQSVSALERRLAAGAPDNEVRQESGGVTRLV